MVLGRKPPKLGIPHDIVLKPRLIFNRGLDFIWRNGDTNYKNASSDGINIFW